MKPAIDLRKSLQSLRGVGAELRLHGAIQTLQGHGDLYSRKQPFTKCGWLTLERPSPPAPQRITPSVALGCGTTEPGDAAFRHR
jgi:hypothetical protein